MWSASTEALARSIQLLARARGGALVGVSLRTTRGVDARAFSAQLQRALSARGLIDVDVASVDVGERTEILALEFKPTSSGS